MAKAKKLPSGSWRAQVYDHSEPVFDSAGSPVIDPKTGKQKQKRIYVSFTASTRKEAEYMAAEHALNKKDRAEQQESLTVKEAIKRYIDSRENVLSPSTIREYRRMHKTRYTYLEDISIYALTQEQVQTWVGILAKTISAKSINNSHGLLSATLAFFRPDIVLRTTLPQRKKPQLYVPSDKDVKTLLDTIKGTDLEVAVYLAAFGPMRRGELCAVENTDVHGNFITVSKAMVRNTDGKWLIKAPKTVSSNRDIEYPSFVIDRISGIQGRLVPRTPDVITSQFMRAREKAGIHPFRFHDLRHYTASILHAIGIPDQYIMLRGGWASDTVLKSVYRGTIDDQVKKFDQKAINHFDNIIQHEMQHEKTKPQ